MIIRADLPRDLHLVVDDEGCPVFPAHRQRFFGNAQVLGKRPVLYAELHPVRTALAGQLGKPGVGKAGNILGDVVEASDHNLW
jgi:hypothetical protein